MEKRKEINDKLVRWIVEKVKRKYADDISLVLIYGSYVNGTANSKSDVDCYFIPKTERGYELSMGFIINGVGYDIFPMSWERVEKIACLQECLLPLVGDAEILYANSAGDVERFRAIQARLQCNLSDDGYVREKAEEKCGEAGRLCSMLERALTASEARKTAGTIIMTLADAVAVYQHKYYHFGLKRQFEDLQDLPDVPQEIVQDYRRVVEADTGDEAAAWAKKMLRDVSCHLGIAVPLQRAPDRAGSDVGRINASQLAGLYEEISSTFNKIYVCCESGNAVLAFLSAVCLQRELDEAREAGCPPFALLSDFNWRDLDGLSAAAQRIEKELVLLIEENGGYIHRYCSFEAFELENAG